MTKNNAISNSEVFDRRIFEYKLVVLNIQGGGKHVFVT